MVCPCCNNESKLFATYSNVDYYSCSMCKSLHIDSDVIKEIDSGRSLVKYNSHYWDSELSSSRERSFGVALARMAELVLYARKPIRKFLDIGTGAGYFLDAVTKYLPNHKEVFYGVEKFPPPNIYCTNNPNFIVGELGDIEFKVDAGMCIEVIEHMTPQMVRNLAKQLAKVSEPNSIYIFNTGLNEYVLHEDRNYLDPYGRGHIVSYSLEAVRLLVEEFGFNVMPIIGKTWAFVLEYLPTHGQKDEDIRDRIWTANQENTALLTDKEMGSVLCILGMETTRAYR